MQSEFAASSAVLFRDCLLLDVMQFEVQHRENVNDAASCRVPPKVAAKTKQRGFINEILLLRGSVYAKKKSSPGLISGLAEEFLASRECIELLN
jgi:hypothetical protein